MKKLYSLIMLCLGMATVYAQPGTLDPSFGSNGVIITETAIRSNVYLEFGSDCLVGTDGKIYLIFETGGKTMISRRMANGQADITYGNNGYSDLVNVGNANAVWQQDGKIIIGGGSNSNVVMARFNTNGLLDGTFGNDGITVNDLGSNGDFMNALAIAPDGKIYAGGTTIVNGNNQSAILRFTPAGLPDASFGTNGIIKSNFGWTTAATLAIALQPDGKLIALSQVSGIDGGDYTISRYTSVGEPDLSFNGTGMVTTSFYGYDIPVRITVAPDGSIYTGGYGADPSGTGTHYRIAKFTAGGNLDPLYNNGEGSVSILFGASNDMVSNMVLQPDGKLLASGITDVNSANSYDIGLVRLNPDGSPDNSFGTNGLVTADYGNSYDGSKILALKPDGGIIAGGYNDRFAVGGLYDYSLFQFTPAGVPDAGFGTGGVIIGYFPGSYASYTSIFRQTDGKIMAVGDSNDGNQKTLLSRFTANGLLDNTFGQNGSVNLDPDGAVNLFQPDGKLLRIITYFSASGGDFKLYRLNPDGSPDLSFGNGGTSIVDLGGNEYTGPAVLQPDGKIVIAGYRFTDNGTETLVARFTANGFPDNSFGTNGTVSFQVQKENYMQSVTVQSDGKIIMGGMGYTYPPDFSYIHYDVELVRLTAAGIQDNSFGQGGTLVKDFDDYDLMGVIRTGADGKITYTWGTYGTGASNLDYYTSRLNADGNVDNSFGQAGTLVTDGLQLIVQEDQRFLVGGFKPNLQNFFIFSLARYNANGTVDNSFGNGGKITKSFTKGDNFIDPALISGNSLYAIGRTTYDIDRGIIAKFRLDGNAPVTCPADVVAPADKNKCTARVTNIDPVFTATGNTVRYKLTGATQGTGNGSASGKIFNKGITTVTYTLNNEAAKTCSFTVTVEDKELPALDAVTVTTPVITTADHKMKDVTVNYVTGDNCGIASVQLSVSSNEPVQSTESGDLSPDWEVLDNHHIRLRGERLQSGNGRVYTITVTVTDLSGNNMAKTTTVKVPKPPACLLQLTAAPNPSHNYFLVTVLSSCNDAINVRVLNNSGNTVSVISNITVPKLLKLGTNFTPGIYYVEATQGSVIKNLKLVKQ